jgi:hypothetical protein
MLNRIVWVVFFISIAVGLVAQSNPITYAKEWAEIDSLIINKDLPKSALQKVKALKLIVDKANLGDQSIKCLLYQLGLEEKITENNPKASLEGIKEALQKTEDPIQKAILSTILAKQYWNYYNLHRIEVYSKKKSNAIDSTDVSTFAADQLHELTQFYFEQSIAQKKLLANTPLNNYNALVLTGTDSVKLLSLYDLLVNEALEYYKGNDFGTPDFVNDHEWMNENLLSTTKVFLTTDFPKGKGINKNWRAVQLFQELLMDHQKDKDPSIFVRINLERIEWAKRMGGIPQQEWLYQESLKEISNDFEQATTAIRVYYLLAEMEIEKARGYRPYGDTANRFGYSKALAYLEKAEQLFGRSAWENNGLYRLANEIAGRQLFAKIEKINQPKKPFRALINYRNTDSVYGRIIKIDPLKWEKNHSNSTPFWQSLTQLSTEANFNYALPASTDHQQHAVEIKMNALPTGSYLLLLSSGKQFDTSKDHLSANYFSVSNLSYYRDGSQFFIRNIETGKPIDGASVKVFIKDFNHLSEYSKTTSDKNGLFKLKNPVKKQPAFCFEIKKGKEYLFSTENEYLTFAEDINPPIETIDDEIANQQNKQLFFFTDRSLYRPGQTVQFKAIAITRGKPNIPSSKIFLSNTPIKFYLKNTNQQKIDSVELTLNEFGSVSGKFILPEKGLLGNFRIEAPLFKYSNTYFSVEEYKRPSFSILFDQNKKVYRFNDSVIVKGRAIAFAGNAINNSKIKYSISEVNHTIQPLGRKSYPYNNPLNANLINGETASNADGEFIIPFKALLQGNFANQSISYYTIEATVTDLNGETHSNKTMITASNKPDQIRIQTPEIVNKNGFRTISATTINAINQPTNASISISLYKIEDPGFLHRQRLWQRPDQFILSENTYHNYFPDDEYNDESNKNNWSSVKIGLADSMIHTSSKPTISIEDGMIESGIYKIVAKSTDSFGTVSTAVQFVQVYDSTKPNMGLNALHFLQSSVITTQPNDTARFYTGSSAAASIYLTRKIRSANETTAGYRFLQKSGIAQWEIIPTEKERGNIIINDAFVYKGRLYTQQYRVEVPFSNKKLNIEYETYRKINEPGKKEEWSIGISGSDGPSKAAELLTTMYDASLDDLNTHQWYSPNLWNSIYWTNNFSSTQFGIGLFNEFEQEKKYSAAIKYTKNTLATSAYNYFLGKLDQRRMYKYFPYENNKLFSTSLNETVVARDAQSIKIRGTNTIVEEDYDKVYTRC